MKVIKILNLFRNQAFLLYCLAILGIAIIIFLLFRINITTGHTTEAIKHTTASTERIVADLQKEIEREHNQQDANQDRILACLFNLFASRPEVTQSEVGECVPSLTQTGEATAPEPQASAPASPESRTNLFFPSPQNTPGLTPLLPENSQSRLRRLQREIDKEVRKALKEIEKTLKKQ